MKTFSRILAMLLICQNAHGQSASIPNNTLILGKTGATNKIIEFNLTKGGATTNPRFRWNNGSSFFDLSNDGTTFSRISRYSDKLSVFAATSSSELAGVLSDETGSGSSVFGTSPTITTPSITSPTIDGNLLLAQEIDSSSTGANVALTVSKPTIILTNVSLTSIGSINSPSTGKTFVILNKTTGSVTVKNEYVSATAANRIITGTGSDLTLSADASLFVQYNNNNSRWHIVGGSGAGGLSAKGQTDSLYSTFTNIEVPHNQLTTTAANIGLIETGNGNILPDPGFEASVSGWTASGGATATANSTAKGTGALGYDWDSNSAAQTLQSTSVTIPAGLAGKNGIAYCNIKTVSGTATHTFTVNDGTNDIVTPITIQSSTTAFLGSNEGNKINFVFPAAGTTIRIKLASVNSDEPEIYLDDCSIQLANNVYDAPLVTQWTAYTPTFTGFGTATSVQFQYRRNGSDLEVRGKFTSGTSTATEARVSFPTGLTSSGTSVIPSIRLCGDQVRDTNASTYFRDSVLCEPSVSYATFGKQTDTDNALTKQLGTGMASSGRVISLSFSVPISGWSAVSAVSADQTDYGDTTYTLTSSNTQGIGTPTGECQHSRVSDKLKIRCKITNGTTTASEMRINLPNSLTSADTTRIPSIQLAGYATFASTNTNQFQVYIEPSVQYLTFGFQGSASGLTKQTGSAEFGTGAVYSFSAEVPIQGWSSNQRAPTLVGSVTSNSSNALRTEAGRINCSTSSSITNLFGNSWMTTPSNISSGICTSTLSSGWSAAPACTLTAANTGSVGDVTWKANATSSTALTLLCVSGGVACTGGGDLNITCTGPR
jgi:hypothetical protein